MAKKPAAKRGAKKSAAAAAPTTAATPSETLRVITEKDFHALLRAIKGHESDKNEAVGAIGGAISRAVEAKHLHKKAFGIYRTLARMSDNKLAETLAHLDHYRNIGGLDERASTQGNMIARTEAGEDDPRSAEAEHIAGKMGAAQKRSPKKVETETDDPDEAERQEQAAHANGGGSFQRAAREAGQPEHGQAIKDAVAAHSAAKH